MQNLAIVFGPFSVIDWFMDFFTLNRVQNKIHNIHQHFMKMVTFLAHLWGAYAIPMALSGVRRLSYVVHRPSCVVCVHHNYQK